MADKEETSTDRGQAGKPVIAAVDFSAFSKATVLWAAEYACFRQSPLLVLHVVHDPAHEPGHYRSEDDDWSEPMSNIAERMMDEFMTDLRNEHPDNTTLQNAKPVLVNGLPAGRIVEISDRENACLAVVGSCGRTGLKHALIGSVAEEVVQHSKVPVTVVKQADTAE